MFYDVSQLPVSLCGYSTNIFFAMHHGPIVLLYAYVDAMGIAMIGLIDTFP